MICKFCSSQKIRVNKSVGSLINQHSYHLYECQKCKSRFFDFNQHPEELREMYNDLSSRETFPLAFTPSRKWLMEKRNIMNTLRRKPSKLLDVGCRTGDFLMHFKGIAQIEGIELSREFAKTAAKRGIQIHNDFIENINFSSKYDVVTCYAILEHLKDPFPFLNKLDSIVAKGGLLVVMVPTHQSLKEKFLHVFSVKAWHMYSPPEHLNFYSRKFLDSYLKGKGFIKVKRYYSSGGMAISSNQSPLLRKLELVVNSFIDRTALSKLPIFDHMYSYYRLS